MGIKNLNIPYNRLREMINADQDELKHLVRNEYMTIELYSWNGDSLLVDAGKISEQTGLKFRTKSIIGYHNEVRVYPSIIIVHLMKNLYLQKIIPF